MVFKNEKELENFLLSKCKIATAQVYDDVCKIIDNCLAEFYSEFTPNEYIRTGKLLKSLIKTNVKKVGKGYEAEVYFDVRKLDYEQGVMPLQHTPEHGMYGWATWDGQTVLDVAMTGSYGGKPHGGYSKGTAIWTKSQSQIGNILERLERELRAQGIRIVKA